MRALKQKTMHKSSPAQKMVEDVLKYGTSLEPQVVEVLERTPRHKFVSEAFTAHAYSDRALPIGHEQTISQPLMVATMTQEIYRVRPKKVLEIGTGSGYQTAVLAQLVDQVFSIERVSALVPVAQKRLDALHLHNVSISKGNGNIGWKEFAPFDAIIITAGCDQVPQVLMEQLKIGGVMVLPLGSGTHRLQVLEKTKAAYQLRKDLGPCKFVPFIT